MAGAERVVAVGVCEGSELLSEFRVALLFAVIETEVFQNEGFAGFQSGGFSLSVFADCIGCKEDGSSEQFAQTVSSRFE